MSVPFYIRTVLLIFIVASLSISKKGKHEVLNKHSAQNSILSQKNNSIRLQRSLNRYSIKKQCQNENQTHKSLQQQTKSH